MSRGACAVLLVVLPLLASGCAVQSGGGSMEQRAATSGSEITFHNRVAGILQENCMACHRANGGAPFALEQYEQVYAMRGLVRNAVDTGRMPPWFADPAHGSWANDASLSAAEKRDILAWIDAGAPEGDPRDAPPAIAWPEGWNIGEPDYVVQIPQPIHVSATERMPYQYVEVKTTLTEDRWVKAMQIRPTAPGVVHHALIFIDPPAPSGEGVRRVSALEGFYAAYGPGGFGVEYPEGMAKLLPAGATLRFEIHYEPMGEAVSDQIKMGFVFADEPPARVIDTRAAFNARFLIPPGHPNFEVAGEYRFEQPGELLGFVPHMHIRGSAFRYDLIHADGREELLLNVPNYDFHWQLEYFLEEPIQIEPGMRLRATGWFDNSPENHHNPDPTRAVPFGPNTDDEMMIGYFHFLADGHAAADR